FCSWRVSSVVGRLAKADLKAGLVADVHDLHERLEANGFLRQHLDSRDLGFAILAFPRGLQLLQSLAQELLAVILRALQLLIPRGGGEGQSADEPAVALILIA